MANALMDTLMDYRSIILYLALFLIVGSLAEIYVRKKEKVKVERNRRGEIISKTRSVGYPLLLLLAAIIVALAARFWH